MTNSKKIKRAKKDIVEDKLYDAAVKVLKMNGWKPIVIGGTSIEHDLSHEYKYRLVIDFMGSKNDEL
jgi:hypothetical protein